MTVAFGRSLRVLVFPALLLAACFLGARQSSGGLFHHDHDQTDPSTRSRGAWLDPGLPPVQPPYYGIGPGRQAGACSRPGFFGGCGSTTDVLTGLHHKYPWFCGYIPASPRTECLYQTGPNPWQRD